MCCTTAIRGPISPRNPCTHYREKGQRALNSAIVPRKRLFTTLKPSRCCVMHKWSYSHEYGAYATRVNQYCHRNPKDKSS